MQNISVFDYTNFRTFLIDYYETQKSENSYFSYQYFSNKAGFKNKGFLYNVIHGSKNISKSSIFKISQAIKFSQNEALYFENLVSFNLAKNLDERNHFYKELENAKIIGKHLSKTTILRKDQYEFYSCWYHNVVRSLIDMYEFSGDYIWLAKTVFPAITPKQAKKSVSLLEKIGLINKNKNGVYDVVDKIITTGTDVAGLAVQNLHLDLMNLTSQAIQNVPREKRNISALILGISQQSYDRICNETQKFQTKIMEIAENDTGADRVYDFNFYLLPVSKTEIIGRLK